MFSTAKTGRLGGVFLCLWTQKTVLQENSLHAAEEGFASSQVVWCLPLEQEEGFQEAQND